MKELIFSVKDIFERDNQTGCLTQYGAKKYHIPAYQRGYKWGSDENGAVTVLLNDLYKAFNQIKEKEYYLQYITIKKITHGEEEKLEVIDGQQRLTTLSILLSVLSQKLKEDNLANDKLDYAIRGDFFANHIYKEDECSKFYTQTWEQFIENQDNNKQDIFYLFSATKKIHSFFEDEEHKKDLKDFYEYLCGQVKIIVNSIESHISSETIFKNLNTNKVALTEAELIKALLITQVGRGQGNNRHFREVMEIRLHLGRRWDEMQRWANSSAISTFYFNQKEGMQELLTLTALRLQDDKYKLNLSVATKDFPLFNFFNEYPDKEKIYKTLLETQMILEDWFQQDEVYNLLGFCRFVKGSNHNDLRFLLDNIQCENKPELLGKLKNKQKEILKIKGEVVELFYGNDDDKIHAILLALSVFSKEQKIHFNFHKFITEKWSLEHIFPQSPEDASEDEKNPYYQQFESTGLLHSIGNMCLLSSSDNASNSNGSFEKKRGNILKRIQKGSFIPKHTFDVFSKMIKGLGGNSLSVWTKEDCEKHTEYIGNFLKEIQS